jgi:hypothetical protein
VTEEKKSEKKRTLSFGRRLLDVTPHCFFPLIARKEERKKQARLLQGAHFPPSLGALALPRGNARDLPASAETLRRDAGPFESQERGLI